MMRLFLCSALLLVLAPAVQAQDAGVPLEAAYPTVTVHGEGTVRVQPDQATVRFGIVTRADDPEEARRENATASRDAMNAVRALGVEERKVRMEALRLQPAREFDPETRRYREVGFEVTREVVVELDDLDLLPTLVTRVVQQGANRLNGVMYGLQDRDAVRHQALEEAVRNAREKADLMAGTLGAGVGRVLRIHEQGVSMPMPMMRLENEAMAFAKAADAAPEPEAYAAGEIEVQASVQLVFVLD